MTDSCIFCKIVANEARAEIVHRDEQVTAFRDVHPVAPTHILIVPNRHIESVGTLAAEDEGISKAGYRLITNTGANGGQTVFHLHVHLIGGHRMRYPMG